MTSAPRVSVVMIFLDSERFIDESIASVVGQTFGDWELVLVDDGSTDASTDRAKRWAADDPRIRYFDHDRHANLGMSAARNLGLSVARGEYVTFLDSDDIWLPRHLALQVEILDTAPSVDATYGTYRLWHSWSGDPEDAVRDTVARIGVEPDTVQEPGTLLATYRRDTGTVPAICSLLVRRDAVTRLGGFAEEFRGCFEDQVYLAKVGLHLRVYVSGECTSLYRRHDDSCCAVSIRSGLYHPSVPNPSERQYLEWLEGYLLDNGADSGEAWDCLQRSLVVYRNPFSKPARAALRLRIRWGLKYRRQRLVELVRLRRTAATPEM